MARKRYYGRRRSYGRYYSRRRYGSRSRYGNYYVSKTGITSDQMANIRAKRRKLAKAYHQAKRDLGPKANVDDFSWTFSGLGDYEWAPNTTPSWGARAGAWAGDKLGTWLGRITGLGDYKVNSNSLMGTDPPRVSNGSNLREIIISHREYIGDIVTGPAGSFASSAFLLNPGNNAVFPWLSQVAACFQQYKFRGVVFEFKTMSADALNSTNTALGTVIMASNYNVLQGNFASKSEMENTEFSSSCKPSCSMFHPIECDPRDTPMSELYIAPGGTIPDGATPQFYDFCNFQIATAGFQAANVNIGELWVTYEVSLLKPIQPTIANVAPARFAQFSTRDGNYSGTMRVWAPWVFDNSTGSYAAGADVTDDTTVPTLPLGFTLPSTFSAGTGNVHITVGDADTIVPTGSVLRIMHFINSDQPMLSAWVAPTYLNFNGVAVSNTWSTPTSTGTASVVASSVTGFFHGVDLLVTGRDSFGQQSFDLSAATATCSVANTNVTSLYSITVIPPHSFESMTA